MNKPSEETTSHIVVCLYEILKTMGEELAKCLDMIFDSLVAIDFNSNGKLLGLVLDLSQQLHNKCMSQIEAEDGSAIEVVDMIRGCVGKYLDREDTNVKMWVLIWFSLFLNIPEINLTNDLWKHIVSLINLLGLFEEENSRKQAEDLLSSSLESFRNNESQFDRKKILEISLELLNNHKEVSLDASQQTLSLKWLVFQLETVFRDIDDLVEVDEIDQQLEEILLKGSTIIIEHRPEDNKMTSSLIRELNNVLLENLEGPKKLFQKSIENKFHSVLHLLINRLRTADDHNINLLFDWIERIFQLNPELLKIHSTNLTRILDADSKSNLHNILKFITRLVGGLKDFVVVGDVVVFYSQHKKKDWKIGEFLEFVKIMMGRVEDITLFSYLLGELKKCKDFVFISKVVENFQCLYVNNKSFSFLKKFIKRVKNNDITVEEKEHFQLIMEIWTHHSISMFSLCIASGKYKMAHYIILKIAQEEIKKIDIEQFQLFVEMLELPYFSYIRIDLLKFNE